MKRWALGSMSFLVALGVGIAAAVLVNYLNHAAYDSGEIVPSTTPVTTPIYTPVASATPSGAELAEEESSEIFVNHSRIGRARKNRVMVRCVNRPGVGTHTEIKFYSRANGGASTLKQSFEFEKHDGLPCDPIVKDFNNDGFYDLTYRSVEAARGANDVRKLFIYDRKRDQLVYITNSEQYPNLSYNKKLDCLDAWSVYGATTTHFLRLDYDMLKPFATVSTGLERVVTTIDKNGTERVLSRKKMRDEDIYTRYSTFDPPMP